MMENNLTLDLSIFKMILDQEAKKLVGRICKRFEITDDKETIKKECKELIYEEFRDLLSFFETGKIVWEFNKKSEEKNGR
jgi:hypothetical protein